MGTARSAERRLMMLMARQHGLATWAQVSELGLSRQRLAQLLAAGYVRRVEKGLYQQIGAPRTWEASVMGASLLIRGAVASHSTALGLHLGADWQRTPLEVVIRRRGDRRNASIGGTPITVHMTRSLEPSETCRISGIRATTPIRTLLDLAAAATSAGTTHRHLPNLEHALDELLATGRIRWPVLDRAVHEAERRRLTGVVLLRRAVGRAELLQTGRTESPAERRFLELVSGQGLPPPLVQHPVRTDDGGGLIGRVDFAWPDTLLVVEIDGARWHSSPAASARDRERDRRLEAAGWTVQRYSPADLARRPAHVAAALREALARQPNPLR